MMGAWGYDYADSDQVLDEMYSLVEPLFINLDTDHQEHVAYFEHHEIVDAQSYLTLRGSAVCVMKMIQSLDNNYTMTDTQVTLIRSIIDTLKEHQPEALEDFKEPEEAKLSIDSDITLLQKWADTDFEF